MLRATVVALLCLVAAAPRAQTATPYLVKPACMPVVSTPGWRAANQQIRTNAAGVCVSWECLPDAWKPGDAVRVVTYCGTWMEAAKASARIDTIRKAADPLKSLHDAGKRYPIVPLTDPSMAGLPK